MGVLGLQFSPFARRMGATVTSVCLLCVLSAAPWRTAYAQEGGPSVLREALADYAAGRLDEALTKLRSYLAANPGQEEVYDTLRDVESSLLLNAMAKGGEHEQLIKTLLMKAHPAEMDRLRDDEEIRKRVQEAVEGEDVDERQRAAVGLRAAGEYAVPFLVPYLASEEAETAVNAILALRQIYTDGTLALVEALAAGNSRIRTGAAALLGQFRDERAVPALLAVSAKDPDPRVRAEAQAAATKIGLTSRVPGDAHASLANRYYGKDPLVVEAYDQTVTMWSWRDGGLVASEVPAYLYGYRMAERLAARGLRVTPGHRGCQAVLVRALLAQSAEIEARAGGGGEGEESGADVGQAVRARALARAMGYDAINAALAMSLEQSDWDVAALCCDLLAETYGGQDLSASALPRALDVSAKHVRSSAAIAALRMNPTRGFPNAEKVTALAAGAVTSAASRQVLIIDDVDATRSKATMALDAAGFVVGSESQGMTGLHRAKRSPGLDVLLIRANLGEGPGTVPSARKATSLLVIDEILADARTRDVRVIVAIDEANDKSRAAVQEFYQQRYGDKVAHFYVMPIVEANLVSEVGAAAEKGGLGADRLRANQLAAAAASAFATMDTSCAIYDVTVAVGPLAEAAVEGGTGEGAEAIQLQAIRALGHIRAGGGGALVKVLQEGSDELKVEAARALGGVLSVVTAGPNEVAALREASKAEGELGAAALEALGKARGLTAKQRQRVYAEHYVDVVPPSEG